MKRKIKWIICIVVIILLVMSISFMVGYLVGENINTVSNIKNMSDEEYQVALNEKSINNVSIKVKEETITKKGATFSITDKNKIHYLFENYYRIDIKKDNKWEHIEPITDEVIWELTAWTSVYDEYDYKVDWSKIYGELESGEYRIVKEIDDEEIYAEFTIK